MSETIQEEDVQSDISCTTEEMVEVLQETIVRSEAVHNKLLQANLEIIRLQEKIKLLENKKNRDKLRIRTYKQKLEDNANRIAAYEQKMYVLEKKNNETHRDDNEPMERILVDICPPLNGISSNSDTDSEATEY